jgi:hypothetical protein
MTTTAGRAHTEDRGPNGRWLPRCAVDLEEWPCWTVRPDPVELARRQGYEQSKADAIAAVEAMSDFTDILPGMVERVDVVLALRDLKP